MTVELMLDETARDVASDAPGVVVPLPARRRDGRTVAYVAFAAICIIWGTTFVGIRIAIETIPTMLVTGIRFLIAGSVLSVIAFFTRARFPRTAAQWRDNAISGILMVGIGNSLVVWAEHSLSSGLAALLAATIPIWMAVMEWLVNGAPLTPKKIAGLTLGFLGVVLLVAPAIGRPDVSLQFFLAVGAMQAQAIAWNAGTLYSRRHGSPADPIPSAVVQMSAGGLFATAIAFLSGEHFSAAIFSLRSTSALLYLAVFGSVIGYSAYLFALTRLPAGKVSSYAYVNPAVAVLVGFVLLHETVTARMILAMTVILAGVAIIQLGKKTNSTK